MKTQFTLPTFKYVMVRSKLGDTVPIVAHPDVLHSDIVSGDLDILSAGFVTLMGAGDVHVGPIGSDSLRVGPKPGDKDILKGFLFP